MSKSGDNSSQGGVSSSDDVHAPASLDDIALQRKTVLHKAVDILSRREHSVAELTRKLRMREYDDGMIDDVIGQLIDQGYLSDRRFAELYIRQRSQKGYGRRDIESWLHAHGVDRSTVLAALNADMPDWQALANAALYRKSGLSPADDSEALLTDQPTGNGTLGGDVSGEDSSGKPTLDVEDRSAHRTAERERAERRLKKRASLTRYLSARGFDPEQIHQALRTIDL